MAADVLGLDELTSESGGAVGVIVVLGLHDLVAYGGRVDVGRQYFVFIVVVLWRVLGTADVLVHPKLLVPRKT